VWLDAGRKRAEGDPRRVVDLYMSDVAKHEEKFLASADVKAQQASAGDAAAPATPSDPTADMTKAAPGRWGSRIVEIAQVGLLDAQGHAAHVFQSGDPMRVHLRVRAHQAVEDFVFGVGVFNAEGLCVYGTNTDIDEFEPQSLSGDADVFVVFDALDLIEGTYKIDVAVHRRDGSPYDYHRLLYTFRVKSRTKDVGIYRPRHHWDFQGHIAITPGTS
jgi:hypothetical protein